MIGLMLILALPAAGLSVRAEGIVEYLEGDVTINGKAADFGQVVPIGARVQTGPNAQVEISFARRNVFTLGANTVAILNINGVVRDVNLRRGTFAAVLDSLSSIGSGDSAQFRLRTPTAVGGVRGTSFFANVLDGNNTYICVCNGEVEMRDSKGGNVNSIAAPEHDAYIFNRDNSGNISMRSTEVIYHDNDDLDKLADSIDVVVPWGRIE